MDKLLITCYIVVAICITTLIILTNSTAMMVFLIALACVVLFSAYAEHKANIKRNKNL
jgi:hypothetical protein